MQRLRVLNKKEMRRILDSIKARWGADTAPLEGLAWLSNQSGKHFVVKREVLEHVRRLDASNIRIDSLGLYIGTFLGGVFRLSIEGSIIIGPSSAKGALELSERPFRGWLFGDDIALPEEVLDRQGLSCTEPGYLLVRSRGRFAGCGKLRGCVLLNHYSKSRRISAV